MSRGRARERAEAGGYEIGISQGNFRANSKALAELSGDGIAKVSCPQAHERDPEPDAGIAATEDPSPSPYPSPSSLSPYHPITLSPYHPITLSLSPWSGSAQVIFRKDTYEVIAVHIIGLHAADLIQECSNAIEAGSTLKDLSMMVHTHPTLCEVLDEAFKGGLGRAAH